MGQCDGLKIGLQCCTIKTLRLIGQGGLSKAITSGQEPLKEKTSHLTAFNLAVPPLLFLVLTEHITHLTTALGITLFIPSDGLNLITLAHFPQVGS